MILISTPNRSCGYCKHILPKKDGWIPACEAFPDGIPDKIVFSADVTVFPECNNGMKFELDDNKKVSSDIEKRFL